MRASYISLPLIAWVLLGVSSCGQKNEERRQPDSFDLSESVVQEEARKDAARIDSIRLDSIRQDSIARLQQREKSFPKMKMLIGVDMDYFGVGIKEASSLAKTFAAQGYEKKSGNTYIYDPAGPHETTIKVITRKERNWRYDEFPDEAESPYIYMTDVELTFSNEADAIKFVNSSPRKLEQVKRNKNVVKVTDETGD